MDRPTISKILINPLVSRRLKWFTHLGGGEKSISVFFFFITHTGKAGAVLQTLPLDEHISRCNYRYVWS